MAIGADPGMAAVPPQMQQQQAMLQQQQQQQQQLQQQRVDMQAAAAAKQQNLVEQLTLARDRTVQLERNLHRVDQVNTNLVQERRESMGTLRGIPATLGKLFQKW